MDIQQYLKSTTIIDLDSDVVERVVSEIMKDADTEREKAVKIFYFVRDKIKFGFTKEFDQAKASYTLERRIGHCNPKATSFIAMLRAVDIPARQHFVTISKEILRGLFPAIAYLTLGKYITHSFTEVFIENNWIKVDSYVLDRQLYENALLKLKNERQKMGYGVHIDGVPEWDGKSNSFVQFVHKEGIAPVMDHGTFTDSLQFYESNMYMNKMNAINKFLYNSMGVGRINNQIEKIREGS